MSRLSYQPSYPRYTFATPTIRHLPWTHSDATQPVLRLKVRDHCREVAAEPAMVQRRG